VKRYAAFGGILESTIEFPDLETAPEGTADWTLEEAFGANSAANSQAMGWDTVFAAVKVRAQRDSSGFSLIFDDTGRFDVSADGRRLKWYRPSTPCEPQARADVLGRVIPLAMHASGVMSLHASAVSINGRGVAFIAPKFHGKSTLATALIKEGARLITDDVLPVRIADAPLCLMGMPQLRLWKDSARATRLAGEEGAADFDAKLRLNDLGAGRVESNPVPFEAAYLLTPVTSLESGNAVERYRLDSVASSMSFVQHAKLGPLLTGAESAALFSQAASLGAVVPMYDLVVVRDLERIGEVAHTIAGGHSEASSAPSTA